MAELAALYSRDLYRGQSPTSSDAAAAMLPPVLDLVRPRSMVDVGCGVGTWLAAAERHGVSRVVGVEGPWVCVVDLASSSIELVTHNLETPLALGQAFDLAMSVEVAEHVSRARAGALVAELCGLAPVVLFGAAIPGQGGVHHINEEWQSVWAARFASHDYVAVDLLRARFWGRAEIPVHYRQNTLLYVHQDRVDELTGRHGSPLPAPAILDLVHPEVELALYDALTQPQTSHQALTHAAALLGALWRSLRVRLAGARRGRGGA